MFRRKLGKKGQKAHFGRIFEICSLKGSELPKGHPQRKYKGRSVFQGNQVRDENADHAIFAELGSSPARMEAGKIIDVFGSQPGYAKQQADARQAYTQALFEGIATWVRLPRNRWPKSWTNYRDPVCPLRLALYGHPDSGGIWEKHCTKQLRSIGWVPVLPDMAECLLSSRTRSSPCGLRRRLQDGWTKGQSCEAKVLDWILPNRWEGISVAIIGNRLLLLLLCFHRRGVQYPSTGFCTHMKT